MRESVCIFERELRSERERERERESVCVCVRSVSQKSVILGTYNTQMLA